MSRSLKKIVLAAGMFFLGCQKADNPEYHFDGMLGSERVTFRESITEPANILEVEESDGTVIIYTDYDGIGYDKDLVVDRVEIIKDGRFEVYDHLQINPLVTDFLRTATDKYRSYLHQILKAKDSS